MTVGHPERHHGDPALNDSIIAFLADTAARISLGYRCLVVNRYATKSDDFIFTVYERGLYAKKATVVYNGGDLDAARAELLKG